MIQSKVICTRHELFEEISLEMRGRIEAVNTAIESSELARDTYYQSVFAIGEELSKAKGMCQHGEWLRLGSPNSAL